MRPELSVVVCTLNRQGLLCECVESLQEQSLSRDLFEVIVVDNGSSDGTHQFLRGLAEQYDFIRVEVEARVGLSYARNKGWQAANGDYVAFIDDDACADGDWCQRILQNFETVHPRPDVLGGQILPRYECLPPKWFIEQFEHRTWGEQARVLAGSEAMVGFSGSNMAFRRTLLVGSGGFSPEFGMVGGAVRLGEETELFYRLRPESPTLYYDPELKVRHWVPRRNLAVSYRLKRAFQAGRCQAALRGPMTGSAAFVLKCAGLLFAAVDMRGLLSRRGHHRLDTAAVCHLTHLAYRAGYLSGC